LVVTQIKTICRFTLLVIYDCQRTWKQFAKHFSQRL